MSIWNSGEHIGTESGDEYQVSPGITTIDLGDGATAARAAEEGWPKVEHRAERGQVRAYREGFSNHHPDDTDAPACLGVSTIAPWCVPGHDEKGYGADDYGCSHCATRHDYPECGPWVRLSIDSPGALTWWTKDGENPTPQPVHGSVVLDVEAARSLAHDLLEWADRPHLEPLLTEAAT